MNQKAKIGLALLGTGLAAYFGGLFSASKKLQFGNAKLTGKKFRLTDASIYLDLPIINNEGVQLPFDNFYGDLLYNGSKLAKVTVQKFVNNEPVSLPIKARSTVILPVEIRISYFKTVSEIIDMFNSKTFLGALEIAGNIKSGAFVIPSKSKIF